METIQDHRRALAELWRHFADHETATYSPLYTTIALAVAEDDDVLALVQEAPPHAHQPNVLFAAVHDLLLAGLEHPLADVYAGRSTADPAPLFRDVCLSQRDRVVESMRTRFTQTNECGRAAALALGMAHAEALVGPLDAMVDVGTSAGLNLLYDRYHLDFGTLGSLGDLTSAVHVACEQRGPVPPLPDRLPAPSLRVGIDRAPVDARDEAGTRWLLACVWPDTGRLDRTSTALRMAADADLDLRVGDMVDDLPALLDGLPGTGPVCVVSSLAVVYLPGPDRGRLVRVLASAGARRPVVWVSLEPRGVARLDAPPPRLPHDIDPVILGVRGFGRAGDLATPLALVHPHGSWMEWLDPR